MNKLELKQVSFVYSKGTPFERRALDGVSVAFEAGKITGLIGHTGSGKSTLVNLLNGLNRPTEGQVLLDGEDIWQNPKAIAAIRSRVGLVMQYPEYQLFDDTVRSDIGFAPRNMGLSEEEIAERVAEAARFTGIDEQMLERSPFDLSGGQKRRVALAGVIAMRPEVLVLDEPAAGLDPRGRDFIFEGIRNYQRVSGNTVLIVSHSMEDMARYCDRMIVMADGKVQAEGSVEEVFAYVNQLASVGLDIPQITRLVGMLKTHGLDLPDHIYTVDAAVEAIRELYLAKSKKQGGAV